MFCGKFDARNSFTPLFSLLVPRPPSRENLSTETDTVISSPMAHEKSWEDDTVCRPKQLQDKTLRTSNKVSKR
jgi:hypothetical protein